VAGIVLQGAAPSPM